MRFAAIDIGTNSTRLLISDVTAALKDPSNPPVTILREMEITRLGKYMDETGNISPESADRTIMVLDRYIEAIKKNSVKKFRAVGTRALRQANNSGQFVSDVKRITGIDVEIIDSGSEAELSFIGATRSLDLQNQLEDHSKEDFKNTFSDENVLVLDIGGGSTEFIIGDIAGKISLTKSIDIGSVNMSERFINPDVPTSQQLGKLESCISKEIGPVMKILDRKKFIFLLGLAGTISTIAAVDLKIEKYDMKKIHGHLLEFSAVKKIYEHFYSISESERKKIAGLDPKRADIIIGGTAILLNVMNRLKIKKCLVSEHDILDGIIYSIMQFC